MELFVIQRSITISDATTTKTAKDTIQLYGCK
jgi:hypothetical protein